MSASTIKFRAGDSVVVIAGNDKGRKGAIKEVHRAEGRVVVEGVNLRWKHRKPTQKNPKGERVQIEIPIHASNVMHLDGKGEPTRKAPDRAEKNQAKGKGR
ncbi:MAG: 50S ribosomal protein L24 [Planctomycetes bacterium]|nr:50S ribosomal protein L24 [Planctomycetota bacterium]